ncbi:MAG: tetratricopeptide repeat protein [Planctomycetia bacterium]|nr:tetratricopeptide repeat protein [Planctomycetia bacterium]
MPSWRLNVHLLLRTLAVGAVTVPLMYVWYNHQHNRHATAILDRGRALHKLEDWRPAAAAFQQYLRMRPEDPEALVLRAQTFDKLAVGPDQREQAAALYRQAVRVSPDRHDLRLRRAELLYESGHHGDAADEADKVRKALASPTPDRTAPSPTPQSAVSQADRLVADRLYAAAFREQIGPARRDLLTDAVRVFEDALQVHPGDVVLSAGLADLLAKHADSLPVEQHDAALSRAERVIDEIVSRNPGDPQALLAHYRYRKAQAQRESNDKLKSKRQSICDHDLEELLKVAPDDPDVLIVAATDLAEKAATDSQKAGSEADQAAARALQASAEESRAVARRCAARLLEVAPQDRRSHFTVAALYARENEAQEAIAILKNGLKCCGQDDLDMNRLLLRLLLNVGDSTAARATLLRVEPVVRRAAPFLAAPVRRRLAEDLELADAQIQVLEGKTTIALPRLKRLAASVTEGDPRETLEERQRRWLSLASAYSRVGQHDLAGAAYDELIHLDPRSQEYRLRAAAEWRTSGDLDRAIKRFEAATVGEPAIPGAWLALAETRLDQQLRNPFAENRDWQGVETALKQARRHLGSSPAVVLLEATAAIARNDRLAAVALLQTFLASEDVEVAQLPRVAGLLQSAGENAAADAAFERYRESAESPVEFAMVKSDFLSRRGDTTAAIDVLEQILPEAHDADRSEIVRRLVALEISIGSMQRARGRLRKLREANADEVWVYEAAADLAFVARDYADLENCEHELEVVEGPSGTLWRYFRAIRLLDAATSNAGAVQEANRLLSEIDSTRPSWPLSNVLRGMLAERLSRLEKAVESYELAWRSGARNLTAQQRLVAALYRQNRFADAVSYIQRMGPVAASSDKVASQAVPTNLHAGRTGDALRIARAAAELRPADSVAQLWYAQCLALDNQSREAETVFRKAIKLAPADSRTWSGLVWFYSRERRPADARQALDDLVAHVDLPPLDRDLTLARGWDLIGDRPRAEQQYLRLLAEHTTNLKLFEEVGRFYFRFNHDKALDIYEQALQLDPQSTEARRQIAVLWGLRGNDSEMSRALELLGRGKAEVAVEDQRMQAALLLIRGGEERCRQAVDLFTGLIASAEKPPPGDRLLLAKAYTDLAEIDLAQEQYELLLKTQSEPLFQTLFVSFLNRHDRLALADRWLSVLEQSNAGNPQMLELRVDWLKRSRRVDEIEKTVDAFLASRLKTARDDNQQTALLLFAAGVLTGAELDDAAEQKHREIVRRYPARYESLAIWLAERGRVDEALALCLERTSGADATSAATVLVRVLTIAAGRHFEASFDPTAAEEVIAAVSDAQPVKSQLLQDLGVLRAMQGRNQEAISLYERVLTQEPDSPIVMNNLAVVLVDIAERQDEALRWIEKAIAAAPNSPDFLDTKGLVLVGVGRLAEAREIFDRLTRSSPKNPQYHLHLALTLNLMGDATTSREQFQIAIDYQIAKQLLTPAEHRFVHETKVESSLTAQ